MQKSRNTLCLIGLLAGVCLPAAASVQMLTLGSKTKSPQPIGTVMTWEATGTDSNSNSGALLTFQFTATDPQGNLDTIYQYNAGTLQGSTWHSTPFLWTPTGIEGNYTVQVIAKDWATGDSATKSITFQVTPLASGSKPAVVASSNALVWYFNAPSCAAGSTMQVLFQDQAKAHGPTTTYSLPCNPPYTMTFEVAGMYPKTAYYVHSQTITGTSKVNGPILSFTSAALPSHIPFPTFTIGTPANSQTDTTDSMILWNLVLFGSGTTYPDVATDLSGNVLWYYYTNASGHYNLLTRPLPNGRMLTIQNSGAWANTNYQQVLREIDLAGNVKRETNTGIVQQQLLALGATDANPCNPPSWPNPSGPPPEGFGCLNAFHHDAIQSLPNGYTAALTSVEKITPPGTQGDTSGLPVDVLGDIIIVLDQNWNVNWYFDSFQHDGGAPQLSLNRASVLTNTCVAGQQGCPPIFLLGTGIAPASQDWLHGNSLYYWPQNQDILWSSKNQDWVMLIDYANGTGNADISWRMGVCGDFTFNNVNNDAWPWYSGQHEVGIENGGNGSITLFDNGDTRVSPPTGSRSSSGCMKGMGRGDSRGMALTVDLPTMTVTPVLQVDLGVYSSAGGSAQLLQPGTGLAGNGDYYFYPPVVFANLSDSSYAIEVPPVPAYPTATQDLNIQGGAGYRSWRMTNLYNPPTT